VTLPLLTATLREAMRELGLTPPAFRRVLIVDDEPALLESLEALLEDDFDVVTAPGGREALERLAAGPAIDVVLTDQRMPGMLGVDLLVEVSQRYPDTIRMVVTAYADIAPILDAINRSEVYRFLSKPYDAFEVRAAIREALELKGSRESLRLLLEALRLRRSELERTLQELRAAQNQLVAAERLTTLGKLTAGISHEVRNQLATLRVLLGLMREQSSDPGVEKAVIEATSTLERLSGLVREIHEFARREPSSLDRRSIRAEHMVRDTLVFFHFEECGAGVRVSVSIDSAVETLMLDEIRVSQALLVLLRNAARASAGGAGISVRVEAVADEPGAVDLAVSDAGIGMDAETLRLAPTPFFSRFVPPGLGLGLEVARIVALSHGGELILESEPRQGTTARLRLREVGVPHA
jgi:C4-dicarboxylate-specific signal transduction histidine kinase